MRVPLKAGEKTWVRVVSTGDGMRYQRSRRHLRKTAEEPEKETYTDFELELDIPEDANHQQLVAKMPATNMSDNEECHNYVKLLLIMCMCWNKVVANMATCVWTT